MTWGGVGPVRSPVRPERALAEPARVEGALVLAIGGAVGFRFA